MTKKLSVFSVVISVIFSISLISCKKKQSDFAFPHIPSVYSNNISKVIAFDKDAVFLAGSFGYAARTDKGSQIRFENSKKGFWQVQDTGLAEALLCDASFPDPMNGWVVGITGIILHTTDGGKTWVRQESGTENHLFAVCFVDLNNGWAVGAMETVRHTSDGGKTWEEQEEGKSAKEDFFAVDINYNGVYFHDANEGWFVGEFGTINHTTDGGKTWNYYEEPLLKPPFDEQTWEEPKFTLFDVYFTDRNRGFLLGIEGTLLKTDDGGKEWKKVDSSTDQALYSMTSVGDKCWAVGSRGAYIYSTDGGSTWSWDKEAIHTKGFLTSVSFSDENTGWVVGKSGAVFKTVDGGAKWEWLSGVSYDWPEFKPPKILVGE
jgi:photosystem II stability/assembly factor-like uncharacterized protein